MTHGVPKEEKDKTIFLTKKETGGLSPSKMHKNKIFRVPQKPQISKEERDKRRQKKLQELRIPEWRREYVIN